MVSENVVLVGILVNWCLYGPNMFGHWLYTVTNSLKRLSLMKKLFIFHLANRVTNEYSIDKFTLLNLSWVIRAIWRDIQWFVWKFNTMKSDEIVYEMNHI